MAAGRIGIKHIAEDGQRFLHDRRKVHNGWHRGGLRTALRALREPRGYPPLDAIHLTLQNFSNKIVAADRKSASVFNPSSGSYFAPLPRGSNFKDLPSSPFSRN